jgi:hypothetical protein
VAIRSWPRLGGWTVTSTVVVAMLSPLLPGRGDSFPISSYPMFSARREDTSVTLVVAVERSVDGGLDVLPTEATGHGHLTQAVRALKAAVRDGGDRPQRLCEEVAAWVDRSGDGGTGEVGIVTVGYDALSYLLGGAREPTILAEHAWCNVET